ncbi:MAG: hypothetical protein JWP29_5058 [Rhodoferax sp.]|nr:hypothetical protein [Rhodoferax sp.]
MNTSKILSSAIIAVAALASASVFAADDDTYPVLPKTKSTVTRAEVKAETLKAEKNGVTRLPDDAAPAEAKATGPGKTRAQVKAELQQAKRNGATDEISNSYPTAPAGEKKMQKAKAKMATPVAAAATDATAAK